MLRRTRTVLALAAVLTAGPPAMSSLVAPTASAAGVVTTCTLQTLVNPSEFGTNARFRFFANNVGSLPGPTGLLTFFSNGSPLGLPVLLLPDGLNLDRSSYIFETSTLPPGTSVISVLFVPGPGSTPCPPGQPNVVMHEVRSSASSTALSSDVNPSVAGQPVTFTAAVTKAGGGAVSGDVRFEIDGTVRGGPVTVDAGGRASIVVDDLPVGVRAVTASFTSSVPGTNPSSTTLAGGQQVNAAATTTAVSVVPSPSESGDPVALRAVVSVVAPGRGTPTGTVTFRVDGVDTGAPVPVDASGRAVLSTSVLAVGERAITATFAPDTAAMLGSNASARHTVERARTTLVSTGATTGDFHDPAVVAARLTRTLTAAPIVGVPLRFTLGSQFCTATTDASGQAGCTIVPAGPAGTVDLVIDYAGDATRAPASAIVAFVVTREQTALALDAPAVAQSSVPFPVSAVLVEDDGAPVLSGRIVVFSMGSGATVRRCTASTDASGRASCALDLTGQGLGPIQLTADFAQDDYYVGSSAVASVIVYAFPSSGAFAIGDRSATVGSPVMFFGSDWDRRNRTSAGEPPSSFKGFTAAPGSPIACGATFRARTGNSAKPPSSVPSFMGTIVTSSVDQNGSAIIGTRSRLVIVRTSSFGSSPGHGGTGTVVADIPCP